MPSDPKHDAAQAIAEIIRKRSAQGKLISDAEIIAFSLEQGLLDSEFENNESEIKEIIRLAIEENNDINAMTADDGSARFYSSQFVTSAYAAILMGKEGDLLKLIAEVVRENSRLYPRPVPLDIFTMQPFDLYGPDIAQYLRQMNENSAYRDIAALSTATDGKFLYSTKYLTHAHASLLAEWLDTGRSDNP